MILIGMFDSPFVRRVAVSMRLLDMPFEHRNWSVGKDQAEIRRFNPLGRVPTLVLDDSETLIESSAILDHLDDAAGPARALLPRSGAERRLALKLMSIATGAAEKGLTQLYEDVFRPEEKRHEPWVARCRSQMQEALAELDRYASRLDGRGWLLGSRITQADITVATAATFLHEALNLDPARYPALMRQVARCEALPAFRDIRLPFFSPQPGATSA
jgi:glutathione S-transferase